MEPQAAKKNIPLIPDDGEMKFTKQERDKARRDVMRMLEPIVAPKVKPSKGRKSAR